MWVRGCFCRVGLLTVTEYQKLVPLPSRYLAKQRQEVVRNTLRILAHDTAGMSTARVEVAEQSAVPLLEGLARLFGLPPFGFNMVANDGLNHHLCMTICVGGANGAVLGNGDHARNTGGITVDSGGGREDNVGDIVLGHGAEQGDAAADIDTVVLQWDFARLANGLQVHKIRLLADGHTTNTDGHDIG